MSRKTNLVSSRSRTRRQLSFEFYAGANVAALAWACVPSRGNETWERIPASATLRRRSTDDDLRHACLRVRHFGRIPVQSELCRFINRVDALTGRGINLCNNLTDPRRIDRKKKRPRSIVERFLEF